jgi:hypothetical protein
MATAGVLTGLLRAEAAAIAAAAARQQIAAALPAAEQCAAVVVRLAPPAQHAAARRLARPQHLEATHRPVKARHGLQPCALQIMQLLPKPVAANMLPAADTPVTDTNNLQWSRSGGGMKAVEQTSSSAFDF